MNNFLLYQKEEIEPGIFQITDQLRLKHVHQVLKSKKGDVLRVCYVGQSLGEALIEELSLDLIRLKVLKTSPGQLAPFRLLVGLSRPPTCQKIMEHGTTLGVREFYFFKAELSEKSYLDSKLFKDRNYLKYLQLGLSQSSVYHQIPSFNLLRNIYDIPNDQAGKFLLSLNAKENFLELDRKLFNSKPITLAIGPERGWTNKEEELLMSRGFIPIKVSPATLRVETAIFAALGQLQLLFN